jgi:uncharacterized membrane protein YdcZ (DUF606 family)
MQVLRKPLSTLSRVVFMMLSLFLSFATFAQDKKVDVNISTGSNNGFFASPWVWVVGAAVFILLLVALLRGGSRRDA